MGWSYRIIASPEAAALMETPGEYIPRTPLGAFRSIHEWVTSRAREWHPRDVDQFTVTLGEDGYVVLHLVTMRWHDMMSNAFRETDRGTDKSYAVIHRMMASYVPRDDEEVIEINVDGHGTGDTTLIAQCAAWLNAAVFDCQSSVMLTPEQWMQRIRGGT
jgi:hypothetical protein